MTLNHLLPSLYDRSEKSRAKTVDTLFALVDWIVKNQRHDLLDDLMANLDPTKMHPMFAIVLLCCPWQHQGMLPLKNRDGFVERFRTSGRTAAEQKWIANNLRLLEEASAT